MFTTQENLDNVRAFTEDAELARQIVNAIDALECDPEVVSTKTGLSGGVFSVSVHLKCKSSRVEIETSNPFELIGWLRGVEATTF